jgi:hypothetical protein
MSQGPKMTRTGHEPRGRIDLRHSAGLAVEGMRADVFEVPPGWRGIVRLTPRDLHSGTTSSKPTAPNGAFSVEWYAIVNPQLA